MLACPEGIEPSEGYFWSLLPLSSPGETVSALPEMAAFSPGFFPAFRGAGRSLDPSGGRAPERESSKSDLNTSGDVQMWPPEMYVRFEVKSGLNSSPKGPAD